MRERPRLYLRHGIHPKLVKKNYPDFIEDRSGKSWADMDRFWEMILAAIVSCVELAESSRASPPDRVSTAVSGTNFEQSSALGTSRSPRKDRRMKPEINRRNFPMARGKSDLRS